ncbi:hypothetical protein EDC01DRAFT_673260 [Geopyxis carbonaria]|nr:hypothetical protein EDC01DRAFT_673260 [Geopyxis carbonaria]
MVHLSPLIVALLSLSLSTLSSAIPAPAPSSAATCKRPAVRKEWRTLKTAEKKNYIDAVLCLHATPGVNTDVYPGLARTTRFEDFLYLHKTVAPYIHYTGQFFAWHRYFLNTYEQALRDECGLRIPHPYWDITMDADALSDSPVWHAKTGFGGNGAYDPGALQPDIPLPPGTGGGCVQDGPFRNWRIHLARNNTAAADDRCLNRSFGPVIAADWAGKAREESVLAQKTFHDMVTDCEGGVSYENFGIHGAGHGMVGGTNADLFVSPSDPVFYLHHANMDRLWRVWQKADLKNRLYEVSGSPIPWTLALNPDLSTIPAGNVTLDFEVDLKNLGTTKKIRQLMDTKGGFLCYDYAVSPGA